MKSLWLPVAFCLSLGLGGCDDPASPETSEPVKESAMNLAKPDDNAVPEIAKGGLREAKAGAATLQDDSARMAQLLQEIKQLVGTAAADAPAQCRKVGFGHKPCGGPASYLVYSVKDLNEAQLLSKVQLYNQLTQAEHERLGLVSDCAVVPEPGIALVDGVCVASSQGDLY